MGLYEVTALVVGFMLVAYLLAAWVIGRFLVYNDIPRRKRPDAKLVKDYDYEDVVFTSFDGLTIKGWFIRASNNPTNRTLILLHGYGLGRSRARLGHHIRLFLESGYHVLAYDQRAHGASDTALITFGVNEGKDFLTALDFLGRREDVDVQRLGAVGFSLGASAIVHAFANSRAPDLKAVAGVDRLVTPPGTIDLAA